MAKTNAEHQRLFKARMYEAGIRQKAVWVKKAQKQEKSMNYRTFTARLKKLTSDWKRETCSELYTLFISIIEAKKEVAKKRSL